MEEHDFNHSVTVWISDLKRGDEDAAGSLWDRYFSRLVRVAQRKLGSAPRRVADEEDVAVGVFNTLCQGAAQGQFGQLRDRDDLWRLLVAITSCKAVDQLRQQTSQKRGGGSVRGESIVFSRSEGVPTGFEQFIDSEPTPEFVALMEEENTRLLGRLRDDTQRKIASYRMEGYSNEEISQRLDISLRSVERKLKLIRATWEEEVIK